MVLFYTRSLVWEFYHENGLMQIGLRGGTDDNGYGQLSG